MSEKPIIHGPFIDTINYAKLIELDSHKVVKNQSSSLNAKLRDPKDTPKKKVYSGRKGRFITF